MKKPLKFTGYAIGFQEVPDETSLLISVSGCERRCEGCHSKHLWDYEGDFLSDNIYDLLDEYFNYITCVCFLGGDQSIDELKEILQATKSTYGLKTCLYTGSSDISSVDSVLEHLDYLKLGCYEQCKGGLDSPTTNQRFYQKTKEGFRDITYKFQKESYGKQI